MNQETKLILNQSLKKMNHNITLHNFLRLNRVSVLSLIQNYRAKDKIICGD